MKSYSKRIVCAVLAVIMVSGLLCVPVCAAVYSSEYLNSYSADVIPEPGGKLVISACVNGVDYMDEIGVRTIFLYESRDGVSFTRVALYEDSDYPEMMGSGILFYEDLFTYQGKVGYYYYASTYVYAGKDGGGDTRNYTTSTVRAIK